MVYEVREVVFKLFDSDERPKYYAFVCNQSGLDPEVLLVNGSRYSLSGINFDWRQYHTWFEHLTPVSVSFGASCVCLTKDSKTLTFNCDQETFKRDCISQITSRKTNQMYSLEYLSTDEHTNLTLYDDYINNNPVLFDTSSRRVAYLLEKTDHSIPSSINGIFMILYLYFKRKDVFVMNELHQTSILVRSNPYVFITYKDTRIHVVTFLHTYIDDLLQFQKIVQYDFDSVREFVDKLQHILGCNASMCRNISYFCASILDNGSTTMNASICSDLERLVRILDTSRQL